jgi:hypothetical protein
MRPTLLCLCFLGCANDEAGPPLAVELTQVTLQSSDDKIFCQYIAPDGHERWLDRFTVELGAGSHHLVAFRRKDPKHEGSYGPRECDQLDLPDGIDGMLPGSQQMHSDLQLPDGVAMRMDADHGLFFQFHFIDATPGPIQTKVSWSAHTVAPSHVREEAAMLFYSQWDIKVPQGESTQSDFCNLQSDIHLWMATGHMHRHGLSFDARAGEMPIYHTDTWDSPGGAILDLALPKGTPITWSCEYQNDTSRELDFGPSATNNEMCIFAGLFYPGHDTDFGCMK